MFSQISFSINVLEQPWLKLQSNRTLIYQVCAHHQVILSLEVKTTGTFSSSITIKPDLLSLRPIKLHLREKLFWLKGMSFTLLLGAGEWRGCRYLCVEYKRRSTCHTPSKISVAVRGDDRKKIKNGAKENLVWSWKCRLFWRIKRGRRWNKKKLVFSDCYSVFFSISVGKWEPDLWAKKFFFNNKHSAKGCFGQNARVCYH